MFNKIGLHVGLKIFFQTNGIIEFDEFLKQILNKITIKMCNCYLQIKC
jgi:hypothetical protein